MPIKMLFLPLSARVSIAAIQSQLMQARWNLWLLVS
jgi:hypothetical protein